MFVIKDTASGIYFSNKNRVILFEDPSLAADFANAFMQFAFNEAFYTLPFFLLWVYVTLILKLFFGGLHRTCNISLYIGNLSLLSNNALVLYGYCKYVITWYY